MASSNRSCVVVDGQLASDFVELSSETRANGLVEFILGGGFKYLCYFHPYLGNISILTNIFPRGWFNHQLEMVG